MTALTDHTLTARAATQRASGLVHRLGHSPRELADAAHHLHDVASATAQLLHHLRQHAADRSPSSAPSQAAADVLDIDLRPNLDTAISTCQRACLDLNLCADALDQLATHTSHTGFRL